MGRIYCKLSFLLNCFKTLISWIWLECFVGCSLVHQQSELVFRGCILVNLSLELLQLLLALLFPLHLLLFLLIAFVAQFLLFFRNLWLGFFAHLFFIYIECGFEVNF